MKTGTYVEAYEEGIRRWEHNNDGGPDTLAEAAEKEHFARDFAWKRFPNGETNAIRRDAYRKMKRHKRGT